MYNNISHCEDSYICYSALSGHVYLQHRILGFENGTTVSHFSAFQHDFGSRDHRDAFSEVQQHEALGAKTPQPNRGNLVTTGWMGVSYNHCDIAPSDFHLYGSLKKRPGGHGYQSVV